MEDYARHTCHDRSHFHFSRNDYAQHLTDGAIEVLRSSDRRLRLPAVVRIVRVAAMGISRRYGAELALMLASRTTRMVARTMLLEIRRRAGDGGDFFSVAPLPVDRPEPRACRREIKNCDASRIR